MPTLHDDSDRRAIIARIDRLGPASERRWGRMERSALLPHLADQLRMALGDVPVVRARGPLRFALARYLVIHVLPWPRGRAKAPAEAFTTGATTWDADRAALLDLIDRFASRPAGELAPLNPVFGRLTGRDWGVLSYRHLDHHLRQFGV